MNTPRTDREVKDPPGSRPPLPIADMALSVVIFVLGLAILYKALLLAD